MRFFLRSLLFFLALFSTGFAGAQKGQISGKISSGKEPVPFATVGLMNTKIATTSDEAGNFLLKNVPEGEYTLAISSMGFEAKNENVVLKTGEKLQLKFDLNRDSEELQEVVVTGTLKAVSKKDSPVPVEVFTPVFFKKNPSPSLFDALQNVNGVRPQLNCNVCNTGDIHINGLEGPYTMILIDGMPIVSGLSTVYGLSGIPNALVERIEIVKGPASSLYGSEAVGGLINVITKKPTKAPKFSADIMTNSWQEYNADLGFTFKLGKKGSVLTGINYFNYDNPLDLNQDGFTDITLQHRASLFQKWNFKRKEDRLFSLAGRYYYEDRWGGEMNWTPAFRGGDSIYGESIYTSRWEILGKYQLPVKEKLLFSFSANQHLQDSWYGNTPYMADQKIAFGQLTWDKKIKKHDLLLGSGLRYTIYDDNTPATAGSDSLNPVNRPDHNILPGLFIQDEISFNPLHKILLGLRYDRHSNHGNILTPRMAYKWTLSEKDILRFNAGTGFRVVNLFTEEHAALTGSRKVEILESLNPERSYNANLNYTKKVYLKKGGVVNLDLSSWLTWFDNQIIPDYDTDPNKIIYDNLSGHSVSQGITFNLDLVLGNGLKFIAGTTLMDVYTMEDKGSGELEKSGLILTEKWTGTWALSYKIKKWNLGIDYTGNIYGPMRLPLLGDLDPRPEYSPVWSLQNVQITWTTNDSKWELYSGVKNLLNWTPAKNNPNLIARANDPFDKNVVFDPSGQVLPTANNPYALSFDPSYVYAPNQGIRAFLGLRYKIGGSGNCSSCF